MKKNNIAKNVKLADLSHNSDLSRIPFPTKQDYKRNEKYQIAMDFLNDNEFESYHEYKMNN